MFLSGLFPILARCASAAIVVAASDSSDEEKARADLVCDGRDDQEELAASLARAKREAVRIDVDPKTQTTVDCAVNHAVQWLPGVYRLSGTLEVPDAANCVIEAEGTVLRYEPQEGDAVVIRGMNRCRYRFGTIESATSGAALKVAPRETMPALMSFVDFAGLIGQGAQGIGLHLDPTEENVCVNRFVGTDVMGFDKGVLVGGAGGRTNAASTQSKCDTNWFWLSYVRMCRTCVEEGSVGVDCSVWEVNVDASLPDSVAIRAGGLYGKWYVIMGTYTFEKKNKALILEPGARQCVFDVHPPLADFAWEDNSGNDTNVIGGPRLSRPRAAAAGR
ncbi:MAG: hypothetical protein IT424_07105 [Pirellulales bacterium]|nr:hypothetical protein [Pirellulales bacterium]